MTEFLKGHALPTQKALLNREAGPENGLCAVCKKDQGDAPLYRCTDCFFRQNICCECLLAAHRVSPFHRVEEWKESVGFWRRTTQLALGQVFNLGHASEPCTNNPGEPRRMTAVHSRGVEEFDVRFCGCVAKGEMVPKCDSLQLVEHDLFPGSWKTPLSVYTMTVLKDFHLLSLQSQIPGGDFTKFLERSTDNVDPDSVPVSDDCASIASYTANKHYRTAVVNS